MVAVTCLLLLHSLVGAAAGQPAQPVWCSLDPLLLADLAPLEEAWPSGGPAPRRVETGFGLQVLSREGNPSEPLLLAAVGLLHTRDSHPQLVAGDGQAFNLTAFTAALAIGWPAGVVLLLDGVSDDLAETARWLVGAGGGAPVGVLVGDGELLPAAARALAHLAADENHDGAVSCGELFRQVTADLTAGRVAATVASPAVGELILAGRPGPDTAEPWLQLTSPVLLDEQPVRSPGPLRVAGRVADNRVVSNVLVNGSPAALARLDDATSSALGYPGRAWQFNAEVPLADAGPTPVRVEARDAAGNSRAITFQALWQPAGELGPPTSDAGMVSAIDKMVFEWNVTEDWRFGFRMRVDARVHGRAGVPCRALALFRWRNGSPLRDLNGQFTDAAGNVAASTTFVPEYDHAAVSDIVIFMPQRELHLPAGERRDLAVEIVLSAEPPGREPELLARAGPYPMTVTEPAQTASILAFTMAHNVQEANRRGVRFSADFTVVGLAGRDCQAAVYLQTADGVPLRDTDGRWRAGDGTVAAFADFVPTHPAAQYESFSLFLPFEALELRQSGRHRLRARLVLWDRQARRAMDASAWTYFDVDLP